MGIANKTKSLIKKNMKKNGFLTGALILAIAGLACRLLGVVFRIPLTNIVGNFGMGLYQMVFPLYSLLLIVSSAGIPIAISKLVAKEKVSGNIHEAKKILFNALVLLGFIGAIVSALFLIFSFQIASLQGNRDVGIIYIAIAPSVFIVCLISAFRGYFQGLQNMVPTAVSQIIEQLAKVAAGITLALLLFPISVEMAVFGAILAVTISEIVALVFLIIVYLRHQKKLWKTGLTEDTEELKSENEKTEKASDNEKTAEKPLSKRFQIDKKLMWKILKQSFPITLMASIFPLILVFDSMVVINMLKVAGENQDNATKLFGISSGAVHTLINLPAVLGVAVATAVVPTVTSLLKQKKFDEVREKSSLAIKLTFLVSLFFAGLFIVFNGQIIDLLYHGAFKDAKDHFTIARHLLMIESVMIVLMGLSQVFTAMLQGADKAKYPLIALAIGGGVKVIFELSLITVIGVYAVSIANVLCFAIAAAINTWSAIKIIKIKPRLSKVLFKALALAGIFAGGLLLLALVMPAERWWVLLTAVIAFILYCVLVWLLKFFNKSETEVFSKLTVKTNK